MSRDVVNMYNRSMIHIRASDVTRPPVNASNHVSCCSLTNKYLRVPNGGPVDP